MTNQRALANLLDAVEGVLAYDWCDNDSDAVEAIDRLRKANDDYGVVQRLSAEPTGDWDRLLRQSVPARWKDCTSPVGAVQSYIAELEQRLAKYEDLNAQPVITDNS